MRQYFISPEACELSSCRLLPSESLSRRDPTTWTRSCRPPIWTTVTASNPPHQHLLFVGVPSALLGSHISHRLLHQGLDARLHPGQWRGDSPLHISRQITRLHHVQNIIFALNRFVHEANVSTTYLHALPIFHLMVLCRAYVPTEWTGRLAHLQQGCRAHPTASSEQHFSPLELEFGWEKIFQFRQGVLLIELWTQINTKSIFFNKLRISVQWMTAAGVCPDQRKGHLSCRSLLHENKEDKMC